MAWFFLFIAAIFEIGWPIGFKLSQTTDNKLAWILFSVLSMTASGVFLWLAQRTIPIGTAYAVWTGTGAVGIFILGIFMFKDPANFLRILSATLIVIGVVGLKLSYNAALIDK